MTSTFASRLLIGISMLSSALFADPNASFEKSKAQWEALKKRPDLSYTYTTEYQSWIGFGQTTSMQVIGDKVMKRSFEHWRWYYDYDDNSTYKRETLETWIETQGEIGSHEEGESPKNLDQVYDQCQAQVLSLEPEEHTIEFRVDDRGLIKTCRARNIYCADDCWEGIDIIALDISNKKAPVAGCKQDEERVSCEFPAGTCNYLLAGAGMFIDHCGYRNEEIYLRETEHKDFCPSLSQYFNGYFLSREDWIQNTACSPK